MAAKAKKTPKFLTYTANDGTGRIVTRRIPMAEVRAIAEEKIFAPMRRRRAFFEKPKFKALIEQFRVATAAGPLSQDDVADASAFLPFDADDFRRAFETVMEVAPNETKSKRMRGGFTCLTKTYNGLDFSVLIGQGSFYTVSRSSHPEMKPVK